LPEPVAVKGVVLPCEPKQTENDGSNGDCPKRPAVIDEVTCNQPPNQIVVIKKKASIQTELCSDNDKYEIEEQLQISGSSILFQWISQLWRNHQRDPN